MKQSRNKKQLTQTQVANRLGIDFTTISKYENDKSQPDNEILQKLSSLYDVSVDWLLTGELPNGKKKTNKICVNGEQEELTEEEAKHLKDNLEMFRLLKAKRLKEETNKKKR
ncbi:MAG: helix-turn-helix transcriptional regulator [Paenibacillaceae bacterium]